MPSMITCYSHCFLLSKLTLDSQHDIKRREDVYKGKGQAGHATLGNFLLSPLASCDSSGGGVRVCGGPDDWVCFDEADIKQVGFSGSTGGL